MTTLITANPTGAPAWMRTAEVGDYGGDEEKEDSTLEGSAPYAWTVFQMLRGNRGTALSSEPGTLSYIEDVVVARMMAFAYWRLPEKLEANLSPRRSDEKLPYWVELYRVRTFPDESSRVVRRKCAAKHKIAKGPTRPNIDQGLRELLGDTYVETTRQISEQLTSPPPIHYWPVANPGDPVLDIGGGAWLSEYSHIGVTVKRPAAGLEQKFFRLMNTEFFDFMDTALPVWCTFGWQAEDDSGQPEAFKLDISQLDYDGLTP